MSLKPTKLILGNQIKNKPWQTSYLIFLHNKLITKFVFCTENTSITANKHGIYF